MKTSLLTILTFSLMLIIQPVSADDTSVSISTYYDHHGNFHKKYVKRVHSYRDRHYHTNRCYTKHYYDDDDYYVYKRHHYKKRYHHYNRYKVYENYYYYDDDPHGSVEYYSPEGYGVKFYY